MIRGMAMASGRVRISVRLGVGAVSPTGGHAIGPYCLSPQAYS